MKLNKLFKKLGSYFELYCFRFFETVIYQFSDKTFFRNYFQAYLSYWNTYYYSQNSGKQNSFLNFILFLLYLV